MTTEIRSLFQSLPLVVVCYQLAMVFVSYCLFGINLQQKISTGFRIALDYN